MIKHYQNTKNLKSIMLAKYAKILYGEACLVSGAAINSPTEFAKLVAELMI